MAVHYTYDEQADALYIVVQEGLVARSIEIDEMTLVDVDDQGQALGIEMLAPARAWPLDSLRDVGVPGFVLDWMAAMQPVDNFRSRS